MRNRVVSVGGLRNPRQQGGFGEAEVFGGLREIVLGGRFHPVDRGSELGDVQVTFQDFGLGHLLFQAHGQFGFPGFAFQGRFAGGFNHVRISGHPALLDEQVFHVLLGQGRSTLQVVAGQVRQNSSAHTLYVDALMFQEPPVLDGNNPLLQGFGDLRQRNHDAVFRIELGNGGAVSSGDDGFHGRLRSGEVGGQVVDGFGTFRADNGSGADHGQGQTSGEHARDRACRHKSYQKSKHSRLTGLGQCGS